MSRPTKATVEYFPHYVNHGKTMFVIESKYGNDGYAFWFKLLELLGASEQHYIDCNNDGTWEYLLAKTKVDDKTAKDILDLLSRLDAIDKELWSHKIIRSNNFIDNLSFVYKRREVQLMTNEEVLRLCIQKSCSNGINDNNNTLSSDINVNNNPQSKVKESKVKKNIKNICAPDSAHVHTESQSGESVEADKVTASPEDKPSKSGPRSPFKSKRQEQLFDQFWAQYPKKRSKGQAEKTWVKLNPDEQLFQAIMAGLERAKTSADWQKNGGQYIPYPSTWLNAKGWEDEYTLAEVSSNATYRGSDPKSSTANNTSKTTNRFTGLARDGGTGRIVGRQNRSNADRNSQATGDLSESTSSNQNCEVASGLPVA